MASLPPQPPPLPPTQPPAGASSSNPQPPALNPPPITRPPRPVGDPVRYPEAPTYPPTNKNVSDALKYNHDTSASHDEDTVVEAAKYEHGILTQALAASQPEEIAPPWFHGAVQALKAELNRKIEFELAEGIKIMTRRLGFMETRAKEDIEGVRNDLQNLKNEVVPGVRMSLNRVRHGQARLEVVPFPNGEDPIALDSQGYDLLQR